MGRTRSRQNDDNRERRQKKKAILAALVEASGDSQSSDEAAAGTRTNEYYTLTRGEMEALINGDVQKIKDWVSSLDRRHALTLLHWLIKINW